MSKRCCEIKPKQQQVIQNLLKWALPGYTWLNLSEAVRGGVRVCPLFLGIPKIWEKILICIYKFILLNMAHRPNTTNPMKEP